MKTRSEIFLPEYAEDLSILDRECEIPEILNSASTSYSLKKQKWRRNRKNSEQVKILIEEFKRNCHWSKELVLHLAEVTGLTEVQVYKWSWDYKKKLRKQSVNYNVNQLVCFENIIPKKLDFEMIDIQNGYKESITIMMQHLNTDMQ